MPSPRTRRAIRRKAAAQKTASTRRASVRAMRRGMIPGDQRNPNGSFQLPVFRRSSRRRVVRKTQRRR